MRSCRRATNLRRFRLRRIGSLLSFVLFASAGQAVEAKDEADESGPIIESIMWTGARAIPEDQLAERIVSTERKRWNLRFWLPDPRLDEFTLEDDLDRITDAYRDRGFFSATARVDIRPHEGFPDAEDPERVLVEFVIDEGEVSRLTSFRIDVRLDAAAANDPIHAPTEVERAEFDAFATPPADGIFGAALYRERRAELLEACARSGFLFARISGGANVDPDRHEADVAWSLELGPRATVASIEVTGLDRISRAIVMREIELRPGTTLTSDLIADSERRLIATGLFRSAAIGRPAKDGRDEDPEGRIDVEIRIEETPPRSARASIGYGTEDGPRGEIGLTWRNFLGNARLLRLRGFGSLLDIGFEGSLGQPYLFPAPNETLARGDLSVSALREERPGYEAFVTGATGLVTFYPDREGPISFSLGMGYELSEILEFAIANDRDLRGPIDSVIVNTFAIARYDRVDDPLDPRHGARASFSHEWGGNQIGSDLDYQLFDVDLRLYRSLGPLTFAARARGTTLDPIDANRANVPVTRRLYSGGTNSIRGFGFEKLGPEDAGNDPIGGLSRLELGAELRLRTWRSISLVGFVDAGDVRSTAWKFRPGELRASAGPGLRIATPVGPLRFDVGFLLNPPPETDPWRIHLSVGHAF